jgi:uncharacterized RDD family membrane protein YckC
MNLLADFAGGGLFAAFAIVVALHAREKTGRGQYIDMAMSDGVLSLLTSAASGVLGGRAIVRATGGTPMQMLTCPRCRAPLIPSLTCPVGGLVLTRRDVALTLGSAGQRLLAYLIDVFIIWLVLIGGLIAVALVGEITLEPAVIGFLLLLWLVAVCFVVFFSIGKRLVGLRIVTVDGLLADTGTGMLRGVIGKFVLGLVVFFPIYAVFDALWLIWDRDRQCLHDKLANTLVVRADPALDLAPGVDHVWTFGPGDHPAPYGPPPVRLNVDTPVYGPPPSKPRERVASFQDRLRQLEQARAKGLLTEEQYREWKRRIRREVGGAAR